MSCIVIMIVEVGQQRPELLGKVAFLLLLSIHPKTNFAMLKTKNQLLACSGIRRRRNSSGAPANSAKFLIYVSNETKFHLIDHI